MDLVQAAVHILQETGKPLHVWSIAQRAADLNLANGADSALWRNMEEAIHDALLQSKASDLVLLGEGFYALRAWEYGATAGETEPVPGRIIVSWRALAQQHALERGLVAGSSQRGRPARYVQVMTVGITLGTLAAVLGYTLRRSTRAQA